MNLAASESEAAKAAEYFSTLAQMAPECSAQAKTPLSLLYRTATRIRRRATTFMSQHDYERAYVFLFRFARLYFDAISHHELFNSDSYAQWRVFYRAQVDEALTLAEGIRSFLTNRLVCALRRKAGKPVAEPETPQLLLDSVPESAAAEDEHDDANAQLPSRQPSLERMNSPSRFRSVDPLPPGLRKLVFDEQSSIDNGGAGLRGVCVICVEELSTYLLWPCKHLCLCENCHQLFSVCAQQGVDAQINAAPSAAPSGASEVDAAVNEAIDIGQRCPVCRKSIEKIEQIFVV